MAELGITNLNIDPIRTLIPFAQAADEAGFSTILLPDNSPSSSFRDIFVALSVIAMNTKRIFIEPGVCPIYTRHPVYLAVAANALQELSEGRFILGLGPGGNMTLAPFDIPIWDKAIRYTREAVELINRLQAGETVSWNNPYFKCKNVQLNPLPNPRFPLYLAARGPQMTKLTGKISEGVVLTSPLPAIKESVDLVKEGAKSVGRDPKDIKITNWLMTYVSDTLDKKAEQRIRHDLGFQVANTVDSIHEACGVNLNDVNKLRDALNKKGISASQEMVTPQMIDAFSIIASPDDFIDRLNDFYRQGVDEMGIIDPIGPDPIQTIRQIGEEVIPHIK